MDQFKVVTETLRGENYITSSIAHSLIKSLLKTLKVGEQNSQFLTIVKNSILGDIINQKEKLLI